MKLNVYSVFDKKVEAFMKPFEARSHGEASRMFVQSFIERPQSAIPFEDLELFYVGEWDDLIGEFGVPAIVKASTPYRVLTGREAVDAARKAASPTAEPDVGPPFDADTRN